MDAELAEQVVVESHELHLPDGAEQLTLLYRVERVVNCQFPSSTGNGTRRHEDDLDALSPKSSYLVD